jgi:hypothetical protein
MTGKSFLLLLISHLFWVFLLFGLSGEFLLFFLVLVTYVYIGYKIIELSDLSVVRYGILLGH